MPDGDSKEDSNGDSKEDSLEQVMEQAMEQIWSKYGASNRASNGTSNGTSIGLNKLRELISNKKKVPYQDSSKVIVELCQDWIETKNLLIKLD